MRNTWNKFFVNFLNGMVLLLPVTITVAVLRFLMVKVNHAILNPLLKFFAPIAGGHNVYIAKTLIFVLVIFAVTMIGWGAKILVINKFFSFGERLIIRVPIMGRIYNATKQIFSSLFGQGKTIFKQVVLVEYPRKGLYAIGFTTGAARGEIKDLVGENSINVFVPTTPNPTSGIFIVVPQESVQILKMGVEEGMKLIISGGAVYPDTVR